MNIAYLSNPLIGELLADPAGFKERGRPYQLLEEYFAGLSVETLRPLLRHDDMLAKRLPRCSRILVRLGRDRDHLRSSRFRNVFPMKR